MRGIRQVSWVISGAIALGMGGVGASAAVSEVAEDRLDWQKILELPPPRGDEGNAFPRWIRAVEQMPKLSADEETLLFEQLALPERPSDDVLAKAEAVLAARKEALEAFVVRPGEFVELPRLRSVAEPYRGMAETRALARLKAAEARLFIWRERPNDAASSGGAVLIAGRAMLNDSGSLIGHLNGCAVQGIGSQIAHELLVAECFGEDACSVLQSSLRIENWRPIPGVANAVRGEFALLAEVTQSLPETGNADALNRAVSTLGLVTEVPPEIDSSVLGSVPQPLLNREQTIAAFGRPFAAFIVQLDAEGVWRPDLFEGMVAARNTKWRDELKQLWRFAHTDSAQPLSEQELAKIRGDFESVDNSFGKLFVMIMQPSLDAFAGAAFRTETRLRVLALLIEMRRRIALGQPLPESVEELRPAGAPEHMLRDPFDGKLLRYDPKRLRVWSVGPDGVDNGGEGDGNRGDSPDLVWSLPVELLKPAPSDR